MTPPALPPGALLEHAAFVRRLAFHLLRDDADADDAAQETMLRAIVRPPRPGSGVRAWLATVLRNVVRMRGRSAARRVARERATARFESTRTTDEGVARDEILRAVMTALAALSPPEREVVFLRHYQGLPPREIAERLGVPVATVKSRLVRAHEHLRRRLDERGGGNVEGWRGSLSVFAGFDVMHRAQQAFASTQGAIAVGTAAKVGGGVLVAGLLAGGIYLLGSHGPDEDGPLPAPTAEQAAGPTPGLAAAPSEAAPIAMGRDEEPAPVTTALAPLREEPTAEFLKGLDREVAPGRIEGIVLDGREPARDVLVHLRNEVFGSLIDPTYVPADAVASVSVGADGTFAMADVPAGLYTMEVAPAGGTSLILSVASPRGAPSRRVVVVLGARTVRGRVFDRLGRPAAGVPVLVGPSPKRPVAGASYTARTLTGPDGSYEVGRLPSGPYLVSGYLRKEGPGTDRRDAEAEGDPSGTTTVDLGTARPEPVWSGVVRGTDGRPLPGPSTLWLTLVGSSPYVGIEVGFDADGRFSSRMPPGTYDVRVNVLGRTLPRMFFATARLTIHEDLAQDVAVPGARLRGTVRDSKTQAAFFSRNQKMYLTPEGGGIDARLGIRLLEDGTFSTVGILPGRYAITGWPVPLGDTSGRALIVEIREGVPEVEVVLWTTR